MPFRADAGVDAITAVEPQASSWTFRLISEVIERALTAGRTLEAERMLERASRDLDGRARGGSKLGQEQLAEASRFAVRLAKLKGGPEWAEWAVRLYRRQQLIPPGETLELLESLDPASLLALRPELEALLIDRAVGDGQFRAAEELAREQRIAALVRRAG